MASVEPLRWLIGGGTGFIGKNVCNYLTSLGHEVTCISRKAKGENLIAWNSLRGTNYDGSFDVVVNLAGKSILHRNMIVSFKDHLRDIYRSRMETNETLCSWINKLNNPPKFYMNASGVGIYPYSLETIYTESFDIREIESEMQKIAYDTEQSANDLKIPHVSLRLGAVLGPNGGICSTLFPLLIMGFGCPIGDGKQFFPWISVEDVASSFLHIAKLQRNNSLPQAMNLTAPSSVNTNYNDLICAASEAQSSFQIAYKLLSQESREKLGMFLLRMMNRKESGKFMAELLCTSLRVEPKVLLDSGFNFKYNDLVDAFQETWFPSKTNSS